MFGRRRRVAPVIPAPVPELSDARVLELLHDQLSQLVGAQGQWTLVPRSTDDTDAIFHGLKAHQIASALAGVLRTETAALRGEIVAEPTALSWTPAPISVWAEPVRAEPERAAAQAPVRLPGFSTESTADSAELARLVA
jgi:hypothetical protein